MAKVYFLEYYQQGKDLLDQYKKQSPHNSGAWENVEATLNIDEADYYVMSDKTKEIPPDVARVIFLGREPQHVYLHSPPTKAAIKWHHEYGNCHLPTFWWLDYTYDDLYNLTYPNKTDVCSVIDSGKLVINGHQQRLSFIASLLNIKDIDIYGTICNAYKEHWHSPKSFKGVLPHRNKIDGLLPYKYHIAIENGRTQHYFSEKLTDALLCWSLPLYYGCTKIDKYFPKNSYITIDINRSGEHERIREICQNEITQEQKDDLAEARDLILNKYNIWPTVHQAVKTAENQYV